MDNKDVKYTTDGKKVVVLDKLNNTDFIVKEVFVSESGKEFEGGEKFVCKSLLDEPAKSWKEKKLEELESRYERECEYWDRKTNDLIKRRNLAYQSLSTRVKWINNVAKEPHPESLKNVIRTLSLFLTNKDIWVFYADYNNWYLEKYDMDGESRIHDQIDGDYTRVRIESMRLVSIFGRSDGTFKYKINEYCDGSGSNRDVEYFDSYDAGIEYVRNRFSMLEKYNDNHIKIAKKFNIELDPAKHLVYKSEKKKGIQELIDNHNKQIDSFKNDLKEIEDEM